MTTEDKRKELLAKLSDQDFFTIAQAQSQEWQNVINAIAVVTAHYLLGNLRLDHRQATWVKQAEDYLRDYVQHRALRNLPGFVEAGRERRPEWLGPTENPYAGTGTPERENEAKRNSDIC